LNLFAPGLLDLLGTFVGTVLTLLVFSYIIGDNFLFRLVIHVFIGVSAGFATVVIWYNVIWPMLILPLFDLGSVSLVSVIIPLLLSLLLFTKLSPRFTGIGSPVLAFLVGVGAAVALGGAIFGTIFPQISSSINLFDPVAIRQNPQGTGGALANGGILLIGTVSTLAYFHFGSQRKAGRTPHRPFWIEWIAWVGQIFIVITFGVLFAGVYAAALTALIERWGAVLKFFLSFFFSST
jgi:hypothetical protein